MSKDLAPSPEALQSHEQACRDEEAMYLDPDTGYWVLTSYYLRDRKTCCGNGCRHCPWPESAQEKARRPDVPAYPFPKS